jgi:hypothetical protein
MEGGLSVMAPRSAGWSSIRSLSRQPADLIMQFDVGQYGMDRSRYASSELGVPFMWAGDHHGGMVICIRFEWPHQIECSAAPVLICEWFVAQVI